MRWFHGNAIFECEDFKRLGKIEGDCCDCLIPVIPSQYVNKETGLDYPNLSWVRIVVCCAHIHKVRQIPYGFWEFEKVRLKKEDPRFHTSLPARRETGTHLRRGPVAAPTRCIVCKSEPVVERGLGRSCLDKMQALQKGGSSPNTTRG